MNTSTPVQITEYCRQLFNLQFIIDAFWLVKSAAPWKSSIQKYELNLLPETCKLQKSIFEGTYKPSKPNEFNISERGKTRHIKSSCINDRIVGHILCDHVLIPTLTPYLIYDNGASLKGKGISFTRNRIATHLHRYYRKYGTNKGYVLLMDFSKYYDNIVHSALLNMIAKYVTDPYILYLLDITFKNYRVDISYMSPEEAEYALYKKFDAIEYCKISRDLLTGERYLDKSISIGDQVSQISAIFYPHQIDNYCKIVKSLKYYDRYMDDTIIIHPDFYTLNSLIYEITDIANSLGIFINQKKTKIIPLEYGFEYLKINYYLTPTGAVNTKCDPDTVIRMRHKLKSMKNFMNEGLISYKEIENLYKSWRGSYKQYLSHETAKSIDATFNELFINDFITNI